MTEPNANLSILPDTISPTQVPAGSNTIFGFTITNIGPGLGQDLEITLTLPQGLTPTSAANTLGSTQITGNTIRTLINQLGCEEAASFSVTAKNVNAQGLLTTTAVVTSSTNDPDPSNNAASITGTFTAVPTPTPTPSPTPTLDIHSLPAKTDDASTRTILAQGSLGRLIVQIPAPLILDTYAQPNPNGTWPDSLAGFKITIGPLTASMVAVKLIQTSPSPLYAIDFIVPDNAPSGSQVPLTLTQQSIPTTWTTTINLRQTEPAFWSIDGTANGPLLMLDADSLIALSATIPLTPGDQRRLLIFASGAKSFVNQNSFTIQVTCQSGSQATLVHDYATTLQSFPVLQQVTIRIPAALAGCGQAQLTINGSQDSHTFLLIQ